MEENASKRKPYVNWLIFLGTAAIVVIAGLLATSIVERRVESISKLQVVRDIPEWEPRNEVWGENYPRQYETYAMTTDTNFASKHGGSKKIDYLENYPELVILWAGYGFSKEYNQGRGHANAIKDIRQILRTDGFEDTKTVGTCWTCKSTDVPRVMAKMGPAAYYASKWKDIGSEIINPIGCQDCHDPKTMNLRITRPALVEALQRRGKDVKTATRQEMRSLVCAQCHVEYYFAKEGNYLTFPWDKGFSADSMYAYYEEKGFSDWTHKLSKAPMLKAQHPDYELFMTGVHASRGVACADCHMPYKMEGSSKFSDHHIQSPLNNIANSCQVCHRMSEEEIRQAVYERQDKVLEIRRLTEKSISAAHLEAFIAWQNGATETEMAPILKLIREAQWRWDWVAAANAVGFHSPVEALRVLGTSLQKAEQARSEIAIVLYSKGVKRPLQMPDVSTKAKAQKFIGLDMEKIIADKKKFIESVIPQWDQKAKQRQGTLKQY
jgi:nitrite reductase (cytochrome c-552)